MCLSAQIFHDFLDRVRVEAPIDHHLLVDGNAVVLGTWITDSASDVVHGVLEIVLINEGISAISAIFAELQVALTFDLMMLGVILDVLKVFEVGLGGWLLDAVFRISHTINLMQHKSLIC
jgi:hypothetical protein